MNKEIESDENRIEKSIKLQEHHANLIKSRIIDRFNLDMEMKEAERVKRQNDKR